MSYLGERFGDLLIKWLIARRAARYRGISPRLAAVPSEHVGLAIASTGLYERAEIELLIGIMNSRSLGGSIMLDIGANIGNHTCALASYVEEIWAFEPNPPVAALLKANILLNGLTNVSVHQVGLGSADAELPFGVAEEGNDGTGSFAKGGTAKTLPVRNGDQYVGKILAGEGQGPRRIGFIKCDVEGFEASVFEGLQHILSSHKPIVMFESGSADLGGATWKWLQRAGYTRLERIAHTGDGATNRWTREMARIAKGDRCTLVTVQAPPIKECNLIALFE